MKSDVFSVAVVGAGAAGLMAAITARKAGADVLLLDGRDQVGAKILMSGGTRCNVTNEVVKISDYETETPRAVEWILNQFPPEQTRSFFGDIHVFLQLEAGGKYFPKTQKARTVLEALLKEVRDKNVVCSFGRKVDRIQKEEDYFSLFAGEKKYLANRVILATGGLSFPSTGSDGSGYQLSNKWGHHLIDLSPSLTPLLTQDADWKKLSGISLPVTVTLKDQKKKVCFTGDFLFTHFGFSGPVALNISRYWIRRKDSSSEVKVNFLPHIPRDEFREFLMSDEAQRNNPELKHWLFNQLPQRLVLCLLKKAGIRENQAMNQLKKEKRELLLNLLYEAPLQVVGDRGYEKAEVTAGGVSFKEVNPRTLESNKQRGLYFVGEILDVDGRIGGFNFQWAWASGYVAGTEAAKI